MRCGAGTVRRGTRRDGDLKLGSILTGAIDIAS